MLDILTIVHSLADGTTAARIRCTCKKLSKLNPIPTKETRVDAVVYLVAGRCHREDGPAIEYFSGTKKWYLYGELHREDGPAVEYENGYKEWYLYGMPQREDGRPIGRQV